MTQRCNRFTIITTEEHEKAQQVADCLTPLLDGKTSFYLFVDGPWLFDGDFGVDVTGRGEVADMKDMVLQLLAKALVAEGQSGLLYS